MNIRGLMKLWLIEPKPGVFIGRITPKVRDFLWNELWKNQDKFHGALLIYSTNNEQGFDIELMGDLKRTIIDMDGLKLVKVKNTNIASNTNNAFEN